MYPIEMSFDKKGIGYIDISEGKFSLIKKEFEVREINPRTGLPYELKKDFYYLPSTNKYLLKVNKNLFKNDKKNYKLVEKLVEIQPKINSIELPIGYVKNEKNVVGQIIPYYANSKSLKNIAFDRDLYNLQKYICLDDDILHNLFMIYLDILDKLEELYDNGVLYLDVHGGNFVIENNEIKVIDFDKKFIDFSLIRYNVSVLFLNYFVMINNINRMFGINIKIEFPFNYKSFALARQKVKNYENQIRKNKR